MLALALGLPIAAAVLVAWAFWPPPPERASSFRAFRAFLAAGCGLALSSCAFFLWFPLFGHPKHGYVPFEAAVCLVLIVIAGRRLRGKPITPPVAPPPASEPAWVRWLWVPFAVSAVVAGLYLVAASAREPHGYWDAFGIWNMRARFLFRATDHWTDTFSPLLWHADYPLFVPATVARAWCYAGEDTTTAPIAVAVVMLVLTAGTLVSGLNYLRGGGQGWVAGAGLLAAYPFVNTAGIQYADVPVSYFFLAAVAALAVRDQSGGGWALGVLAGAAAGFAAWTKNEGLLFVAALVACRVAVHARRSRREFFRELIPFAAGLLPAAVALAVFKFGYAPPNDIVSGQQGGTLGRLLDGTRHAQVVVAFAEQVWAVAPFAVVFLGGYAVLVGLPAARGVPGRAAPWLVLATATAGYYLVYVTTPFDVTWHTTTSLGRLLAQLWPLFLFALFLTIDTPHELDQPAKASGGSEPARPAVPRRDGRRLPSRLRRV